MIPIDKYGNVIGEKIGGKRPDTVSKRTFIPEQETIPARALRTLYKPVKEIGSVALGGIPSFWNLASGIGGLLSKQLAPQEIQSPALEAMIPSALSDLLSPRAPEIPQFPEAATISGVRKGIFDPLGEAAFGRGAMRPQEGFFEGLTERASQILPYALMGPAGLGRALTTTGLQALGGESVKALGGGPLAQAAGELGAGFGIPAVARVAGKAIPRAAKPLETQLWKGTEQRAADIGKLPLQNVYKEAGKLADTIEGKLPSNEIEYIQKNLGQMQQSLGATEAPAQKLIDATQKLGRMFPYLKNKSAKHLVGELRDSILEQLDKLISSYPEARSLTRAMKSHPFFEETVKKAGEKSKGLIENIMSIGKIMAVPAATIGALKFGGTKITAVGSLMAGGVYAAKKALENYKLLQASPTLKRITMSAIKDIAQSNLTAAAHKIDEISKLVDKKEYKQREYSMIPIDKYGNVIGAKR